MCLQCVSLDTSRSTFCGLAVLWIFILFLYKVLYFTGRGGCTPGAVRLRSSVHTDFCRLESRRSHWRLPDNWQQQISEHSSSQAALGRTERASRCREDRSNQNSTSNVKLTPTLNSCLHRGLRNDTTLPWVTEWHWPIGSLSCFLCYKSTCL